MQENPAVAIITRIIGGVTLVAISLYLLFSKFSTAINTPQQNNILILFLLFLMLLISRMTVLTKVGVAFIFPILFAVNFVYGTLAALLILWLSTMFFIFLALRPTPIDMFIHKGAGPVVTQTIYLSLWLVLVGISFAVIPSHEVLSNLRVFYLSWLAVYVTFMYFAYRIFTVDPIPQILLNVFASAGFQYLFITFFEASYRSYIIAMAV
jgi:hypothetical protein